MGVEDTIDLQLWLVSEPFVNEHLNDGYPDTTVNGAMLVTWVASIELKCYLNNAVVSIFVEVLAADAELWIYNVDSLKIYGVIGFTVGYYLRFRYCLPVFVSLVSFSCRCIVQKVDWKRDVTPAVALWM